MSAPSNPIVRLSKEWAIVQKTPVPSTTIALGKTPTGEDNYFEWKAVVTGPENYSVGGAVRPCPYAGARFNVTIQFPETYPFKHPVLVFEIGKLYHPNISQVDGRVCEDMLSKSWGPTKRVTDIIHLIEEFMANPNFEGVVDEGAAAAMTADISKYEADARRMAAGSKK